MQILSDGQCQAQLKWPNDVYAGGRKISGILLSTHRAAGRTGLIIGIGINLAEAPTTKDQKEMNVTAVALAEFLPNTAPSPEACLNVLAPRVIHWLSELDENGFAPIREAWLEGAFGLGAPIVVRLPKATHHGTFEGIDDSGALQLRSDDQLMAIPAGDVFFGSEGDIP